jgi:Skp family chaperone for outer membrane proteins
MSINAATPSGAPAQNTASSSGSVQETLPTGTNGVIGAQGPNSTESTGGGADEDYDLSLDELINADFGDDPVMRGTHRGIPDYKKVLEHIPENGRKLVQNLRASYTQKTQEISDLRKALEGERAQLERDRKLMTESEFAQQVRQLAAAPLQHDAWSDEGLQERINKQAAEMMQRMLQPLQQDLDTQRRQVALDSFKTQHPDLTSEEIRLPVARLLMDRPELKLEDAYFIVKGQVSRQQTDAVRQAQRDTLKKTSTGNAVRNAAPPKFKDAWTAYQWHKTNGGK